MVKKKSKKNIKKNGNVGGKADVHINQDGGRNKSLLDVMQFLLLRL